MIGRIRLAVTFIVILGAACALARGADAPHAAAAGSSAEKAPAPAASTDSVAGAKPPATPDTTAPAAAKPVFHIQLWDAQKTEWEDATLAEVAAAGFTVVQSGWKGSLFPSPKLLEKVRSHGLLYGAYVDTRTLFDKAATEDERASIPQGVGANGSVHRTEFNSFNPIYKAVVARGVTKALGQLAAAQGLYKVMLNSERNAPISYDDLTISEAVRAGAMEKGQAIPEYDRGVAKGTGGEGKAAFADPWRFLMWFDRAGGDRAINLVAAQAAHSARPGILVTTDPLADGFTYGQYHGMDILQDWVRVHGAPRDPLSIAYHCERLKAHVRHEGKGDIWIGPQLGTKSGRVRYAAPADEFEEALWLAVAFGARGATIWGYDTVSRDEPLDMDTWGRVRKFRDRLLSDYPYLVGAADAPRKCAVLLSKANQVFSARPYYEVEENYEHFYRVLLTAHVPADVVYDDDVLEGRLANYKALFLPGIERSTPELDKAVGAFEKSGGRVVRWPFLHPKYDESEITKGRMNEDVDVAPAGVPLLPHQYRKWRQIEAAKVFEKVSDLMDVRVDNPDVIMNVVQAGGKRYVVLVNDARTYGEWTKERGYRWCEDKGAEAKATVTSPDGSLKRGTQLPATGLAVISPGPDSAR